MQCHCFPLSAIILLLYSVEAMTMQSRALKWRAVEQHEHASPNKTHSKKTKACDPEIRRLASFVLLASHFTRPARPNLTHNTPAIYSYRHSAHRQEAGSQTSRPPEPEERGTGYFACGGWCLLLLRRCCSLDSLSACARK